MIDLKQIAAAEGYKTTLDESADLDGSHAERPWNLRIPCKHGHIYVHSRDRLGAYAGRRGVIPRLLAIPGVNVHQRGDAEVSVTFSPERLSSVAGVLRAKRRIQLSEQEKDRRREILRRAGLLKTGGKKPQDDAINASRDKQRG